MQIALILQETLSNQRIKERGDSLRVCVIHQGQDLFSLYVPRDRGVVQLMFPNDSTGYSPALEKAITDLLGEGRLRV